jgi:hypothetical protein
LPQGCAKKIKLQLLLADLALKLVDALARPHQVLAHLKVEHPSAPARPARRPQRLHPTSSIVLTPLVNVSLPYP